MSKKGSHKDFKLVFYTVDFYFSYFRSLISLENGSLELEKKVMFSRRIILEVGKISEVDFMYKFIKR